MPYISNMVFSLKRSLAGPGYIILNCIRILNIIALGAVVVASIVMLIHGFIQSTFFIFDAISHVVTVLVSCKSSPQLPFYTRHELR